VLTVVTSFSPAGWNLYARGFVDSFYEHAPAEATLLSYWEGTRPRYEGLLPGYSLLDIEPSASFLARHKGNLVVAGRLEGSAPWAGKAKREHYSYRHDAYKFARKVFAVADAARRQERGRLFWIDADVVVKKTIPLSFFEAILPAEASLSYLHRPLSYPELGFVGYNLERIETHAFLTAYEAEYSEDVFMRRRCWDDCNVFADLVAELRPAVHHIPNTSNAQPFDNSELARYMVHLKGRRKLGDTAGAPE
jgi:hypothetical protein